MKTLLGFLVCVAILGSSWADLYEFKEIRPDQAEKIECTGRSFSMMISKQTMAVRCMPRKVLLRLTPEPGYIFLPNMVEVARCGGICGSNLSCMRLDSKRRAVFVKRMPIRGMSPSCYKVYVEDDTRCKCKCDVMESHCNAKQIYMPENCSCNCANERDRFECSLAKDKVWNPKMCKCVCATPEENCSTGLEWIPSMCKCMRVMEGTE